MKEVYKFIRDILLADATIAGLVGDRVELTNFPELVNLPKISLSLAPVTPASYMQRHASVAAMTIGYYDTMANVHNCLLVEKLITDLLNDLSGATEDGAAVYKVRLVSHGTNPAYTEEEANAEVIVEIHRGTP